MKKETQRIWEEVSKTECRKNNPTYNESSKETARKWDKIDTKIKKKLNFIKWKKINIYHMNITLHTWAKSPTWPIRHILVKFQ